MMLIMITIVVATVMTHGDDEDEDDGDGEEDGDDDVQQLTMRKGANHPRRRCRLGPMVITRQCDVVVNKISPRDA